MVINDKWSVIRVRGGRGLPTIGGAEFPGCLAAVRLKLGEARWHYRWVADPATQTRDGLRVQLGFGTPELDRVSRALEGRMPPPDGVYGEPLMAADDLDPIQTSEDLDDFLDLLWGYSEFLADLEARNPSITTAAIRDITLGAFLTFVTRDHRHLETAMDESSVGSVPTVALGRVLGLVQKANLQYRIPPTNRTEALQAARIHHLAGCTFASSYYPFRRLD